MKRILVCVVAAWAVLFSLAGAGGGQRAEAANFPTKPITFIIPFDAGSTSDVVGRMLARLAEKELKQTIKIVNKPGSTGALGYQEIFVTRPDGYTITQVNNTLVAHNLMGTFDFSFRDLTPIVNSQTDALALYVSAQAPFKTWDEMVAYSKANPGAVTVSTSTVGGLTNIVAVQLEKLLDVEWNIATGSSGGDAATQAAGGHVMMNVSSCAEGVAFVESGDITPLCITSAERVSLYPDAPTCRELGYDVVLGNLRSVFGPPKMDPEVADILTQAFRKAIESPEYVEYVEKTSGVMMYRDGPGTAAEYAKLEEILIPIFEK